MSLLFSDPSGAEGTHSSEVTLIDAGWAAFNNTNVGGFDEQL